MSAPDNFTRGRDAAIITAGPTVHIDIDRTTAGLLSLMLARYGERVEDLPAQLLDLQLKLDAELPAPRSSG